MMVIFLSRRVFYAKIIHLSEGYEFVVKKKANLERNLVFIDNEH